MTCSFVYDFLFSLCLQFVLYHKSSKIHTESISVPLTSTDFQAKIEAICQVRQLIITITKECNIKYLKFQTDSQAAVKALSITHMTAKCALKALKNVETAAAQMNNLTLTWVKVNVNIEDNEASDMTAKEEATGDMYIKTAKVHKRGRKSRRK